MTNIPNVVVTNWNYRIRIDGDLELGYVKLIPAPGGWRRYGRGSESTLLRHPPVQSYGNQQHEYTTVKNDHGQMPVSAALTDGFMGNQAHLPK
jgi:hypothetical protein